MDISIPYYEDKSRISNSAIGWFLKKGPAYLHRRLTEDVEETSSAMERGTMIHMYLLQPEEFSKTYVVSTALKPQSTNQEAFCQALVNTTEIEPDKSLLSAYKQAYKVNGQSDENILAKAKEMASTLKNYIDTLTDREGHVYITPYQMQMLEKIGENVQQHKLAKSLLQPEYVGTEDEVRSEFHINWEWKYLNGETVKCKSLLDRVHFDFKNRVCTLTDIKTTVHIGCFEESIKQYDYLRQLRFYMHALKWYIKEELKEQPGLWEFKYYIVAIDTVDSHEVRVFEILNTQFVEDNVDSRISLALYEIHWHIENDKWDHHKTYYEGDGSEVLNL